MNYVIALVGIAILIYNGIRASKGQMTISQKCQEFFRPTVDWGIGIGGWIGLCILKHYWSELDFTIATAFILLWGHIWIANKERYKD